MAMKPIGIVKFLPASLWLSRRRVEAIGGEAGDGLVADAAVEFAGRGVGRVDEQGAEVAAARQQELA